MSDARQMQEPQFDEIKARIEGEKTAALASFDPEALRAWVLSRQEHGRHHGWLGSLRLAAACALAALLATLAVFAPTPATQRGALTARLVERALGVTAASRTDGAMSTPPELAHSDDVWSIERGLLTWRRLQGGRVDIERALCLASAYRFDPASCPAQVAEGGVDRGARQRVERALIELERERTIHRALLGRQRT